MPKFRTTLLLSVCLVASVTTGAAQVKKSRPAQKPSTTSKPATTAAPPKKDQPKKTADSPDLAETAAIVKRRADLDQQAARKTVAQLDADLHGPDREKRLAAIRSLGARLTDATDGEAAEKLLLDTIQDAAWLVRGETAFALGFGAAKDPVVEALKQSLKDENWFVRARAVQALGKLKAVAAVADLTVLFPGEDWDTQARIVHALGEIGDGRRLEPVMNSLGSEDESLRIVALGALRNFRNSRVSQVILSRLENETSPSGKLLLVRAVGLIGVAEAKEKITAWRGDAPDMDREVALALYRLGDAAEGEAVVRDFKLYPKAVQRELLDAWRGAPDARALPVLLDALRTGDWTEKKAAVGVLSGLRDRTPSVPLFDALSEVDPETRDTLVDMLKSSTDPTIVETTLQRLKADPEPAVRAALIAVLQPRKTPATIAALFAVRLDDKQKPRQAIDRALASFDITPEILAAKAADEKAPAAERIQAAQWLGKFGDTTAATKLVGMIEGGDSRQKLAAIEALGQLADRSTIESLITSLDDPDASVRDAARGSLNRMGVTADRLTHDLTARDWQIRAESLRLIARLGDKNQVPAVLPLLRDPAADVRLSAAGTLGRFRDPQAVDPLLAALKDADLGVRAAAAAAIGSIGDPRATGGLLAALRANTDATVSGEIVTALGQLRNSQAVPVLLDSLRSPSWAVRSQVARILGEFRDQRAVPPLTDLLEDSSAVVRYYARRSLIQIGVPSPEGLIRLFGKPDGRGRFGAVEVIRGTNLTATVGALLERLKDERPAVRAVAAYALGMLREPSAVEPLVLQLELEDRIAVRWWIAYALGGIGDTAREPILKLTKSKKPRVRGDALRALGFLPPSEETRQTLLAALRDKDEQIRNTALEAIGQSRDAAIVPALAALLRSRSDGDVVLRPEITIAALMNLGPEGRRAVAEVVRGGDPVLRVMALHALGEDGDPAVLDTLAGALRDQSPRTRLAAIQELARQSDDKALRLICEQLTDGDGAVRLGVVKVLGLLADAQALEPLRAQLQREPSPEIRAAIEQTVQLLSGAPTTKPRS